MKRNALLIVFCTAGILMNIGCQQPKFFGPEFSGMSPTITGDDVFWVDKRYYNRERHSRFDLVLFEDPDVAHGVRVLRIFGLAGENIGMADGELKIDEKRVILPDELAFLECEWQAGDEHLMFTNQIVPPGHLYLLGDNFAHSYDSRYVGPIATDRIIGRVSRVERRYY